MNRWRRKGGRQQAYLPLLTAEEAGPAPEQLPEQRIHAQPRRIRLRTPHFSFFFLLCKGKYQYSISACHRPTARLLQRGPAQSTGQCQSPILRRQGPQEQAPAPSPDPRLVQATPVIRADGPQAEPEPLLLQRERPAPLHVPTSLQRLSLPPAPLFYPISYAIPKQKTCLNAKNARTILVRAFLNDWRGHILAGTWMTPTGHSFTHS